MEKLLHKQVHPEELDSWLRSTVTQAYLSAITAYLEHLHESKDVIIASIGSEPNEKTMTNLFLNKGAYAAVESVRNVHGILKNYGMIKNKDEDIV